MQQMILPPWTLLASSACTAIQRRRRGCLSLTNQGIPCEQLDSIRLVMLCCPDLFVPSPNMMLAPQRVFLIISSVPFVMCLQTPLEKASPHQTRRTFTATSLPLILCVGQSPLHLHGHHIRYHHQWMWGCWENIKLQRRSRSRGKGI